jgi:hypothetical protein
MWDLWWTKWYWGRFPPSTSVSPANSHSTDCSKLVIYHPGLVTIGQLVADVPSGVSLTPPQEIKKLNETSLRAWLTLKGCAMLPASRRFLAPWSWKWRQHDPPKRRLIFNGLYGFICQNTELLRVAQTVSMLASHPIESGIECRSTRACLDWSGLRLYSVSSGKCGALPQSEVKPYSSAFSSQFVFHTSILQFYAT